MTAPLRGLVVDDDPKNRESIIAALAFEFRRSELTVEWRECPSAIAAKQELEQNPAFDFAFIDYDLGKGGETGADVVAYVRERSSEPFVVVISGHANDNADFQPRSAVAGANLTLIRNQLVLDRSSDYTYGAIAQTIRRQVSYRRGVPGLAVEFKDDVLGLKSTLHTIGSPAPAGVNSVEHGKRIVHTLAVDCLAPQHRHGAPEIKLTIQHLAAGRSGAFVCRVDREGGLRESFVLKIGLDRAALKFEQEANRRATNLLGNHNVVQLSDEMKHHISGYSAVSARLMDKAVTLSAFLGARETRDDDSRQIAEYLFDRQLSALVERADPTRVKVTDWLKLSPVLRLRTERALEMYKSVWADPNGADEEQAPALAATLTAFLASGALSGRQPTDTIYLQRFGDLHSGNVLVHPSGRGVPILVDASMFGSDHWAADAARLLVDLALTVRRPGQALLWADATETRQYCDSLCRFEGLAAAASGSPVEQFVAQVVDNLGTYMRTEQLKLTKPEWHWQWHVALAKELIRQGTREAIPAPRAVAALASAADHLALATTALSDLEYTH